jgi:SAM-dependent methyltransferase
LAEVISSRSLVHPSRSLSFFFSNTRSPHTELQHRIWQLSLNSRLHLCPLPNPLHNVLDIGCGTGAWAIEFAEAHPDTRVIGVDLSPIQPNVVPPNVEFIVDDMTAPWIFDHKFDYIHSRAITIGVKDWELLINEVWRYLEPGGWVEFQEYHAPFLSDDGTIERCPDFERWNMEFLEAARKAGTTLDAILQAPGLLDKRGFVGVDTASTKWPVGPWAKGRREKRIGDLCLRVGGTDRCAGVELLTLCSPGCCERARGSEYENVHQSPGMEP